MSGLVGMIVFSGLWSVCGMEPGLAGAAGDEAGDVAAIEPGVDVDDDDVGGAGVEHAQECGEAVEGAP
jgi:hypothetical protein